MEIDEFCLRWNNHHSVLISVLNSLLQKELLVDVTLAAEGQYIEVHRIVLCACSKYFEELLSSHKKKQSIIFLSNVTITDLKALVEYMYSGEVNVTQEQLPRFLAAAEILKIKGLADKPSAETSPSRVVENLVKQNQNTRCDVGNNQFTPCTSRRSVRSNVYLKSPATSELVLGISHDESQILIEGRSDESSFTLTSKSEADAAEELSCVIPMDKQGNYLADYVINDDEVLSGPSQIEETRSGSDLNDSSTHQLDSIKKKKKGGKPNSILSAALKKKKKALASSASPGSLGLCTGCSPVNCPSCGRMYQSKGSLNRHRKFECGQEPAFSCPICFLRFKRKDKLKDHHYRHHGQDPPFDTLAAIQPWTLSST